MTPSTDTLMLGRGVKRKWSCLEEELEGAGLQRHDEAAAAAVAGVGQSERSLLQQQRQLVLGLCLEKLQRYQVGVELSLRRSVLLVNTLRQIQEDMRSEGAGPDLTCDQGAGLNITCTQCAEGEGAGPGVTCAEGPDVTCAQCTSGAGPPPLAPPLPAQSPPQESDGSAVSDLGDLALDDIFADIDTSMYEASDLWAAGVSLWADEDAKGAPPPPHGARQACLMDLNELDHIMEILVQS